MEYELNCALRELEQKYIKKAPKDLLDRYFAFTESRRHLFWDLIYEENFTQTEALEAIEKIKKIQLRVTRDEYRVTDRI